MSVNYDAPRLRREVEEAEQDVWDELAAAVANEEDLPPMLAAAAKAYFELADKLADSMQPKA